MKKLRALLFLMLIALPFAGSYIYFAVRLQHIRHEMRSRLRSLPDDRLTKIIMTKDAYSRTQVEEDELEIEGKMFDVARVEMNDDQVTVFGLHDEAEDNLITFLHEILKNASRDKNEIPPQVYQFLTLSFLVPMQTWNEPPSLRQLQVFTAYFKSESTYISVLDPPPPRA